MLLANWEGQPLLEVVSGFHTGGAPQGILTSSRKGRSASITSSAPSLTVRQIEQLVLLETEFFDGPRDGYALEQTRPHGPQLELVSQPVEDIPAKVRA